MCLQCSSAASRGRHAAWYDGPQAEEETWSSTWVIPCHRRNNPLERKVWCLSHWSPGCRTKAGCTSPSSFCWWQSGKQMQLSEDPLTVAMKRVWYQTNSHFYFLETWKSDTLKSCLTKWKNYCKTTHTGQFLLFLVFKHSSSIPSAWLHTERHSLYGRAPGRSPGTSAGIGPSTHRS